MNWILFLDDLRDPSWVGRSSNDPSVLVARSSEAAKTFVITFGPPKKMYLDYDLGLISDGLEDTTMIFLKWLADFMGYATPPKYSVHSSNPAGTKNIEAFMRSWKKVSKENL